MREKFVKFWNLFWKFSLKILKIMMKNLKFLENFDKIFEKINEILIFFSWYEGSLLSEAWAVPSPLQIFRGGGRTTSPPRSPLATPLQYVVSNELQCLYGVGNLTSGIILRDKEKNKLVK